MPPPLPPQIITTILSHLLPPSPPIPTALTAKALLDRLTFLPPSPDDVDAWLSPYPSQSAPLHEKLEELTRHHEVSAPTYAHDGESVLARLRLYTHTPTDGVEVMFALEQGENGRGWVYLSTQAPGSMGLDWVDNVESVSMATAHGDAAEGETGDDYWAGFTPPRDHAELAQEHEAEGEDAYWASYGAGGQSGIATPAPEQEPPMQLAAPARPEQSSETDQTSQANQANQLSAITSILSSLTSAAAPPAPRRSPSPEVQNLQDKILGRISCSLREAWSDFRGHDMHPEALEERAMAWLRVGRSVVDQGKKHVGANGYVNGHIEAGEAVVRAKLVTLRDMYEVVGTEEDGFWRLVEAAVRQTSTAGAEEPTQETYWE